MSDDVKSYVEKIFAEAKLVAHESTSYTDKLIAEVKLTARDDKAYADKLFTEAKATARDEAEKAKKSALAILGSVALVLGIATTLGLKSYFETRIDVAAATAATAAGKKAEEGSLKALLDAMRLNHEKSEVLASEIAANRDKAKIFLEQLLSVAAKSEPGPPDRENAKGYIQFGNTLLCYGTQSLVGATHVRSFAFTFPKEFSREPAITAGINVNGTGFNFGIYKYALTATDYQGSVVETQGRDNPASVAMSYMAIGEAKVIGPPKPQPPPTQPERK